MPMRGISKFFAVVLLIIAVVVSALLVAAAYIEYLSPTHVALPALLGLVFPILAVCAIILFIGLLLLCPKYALVPLGALLLSIPALWQYFPINFNKEHIDTNRGTFTLLSYNVYYFKDAEKEPGADEVAYNRTLQNIIDYNADIVVLQEIGGYFGVHKRNKITQSQIDIINKRYPHRILQNSLLLLSKYPAQTIYDTRYTETASTVVYKVNIEGREVSIFNNHLESIGLNSEDKKLYVALATHPDSVSEKVSEIKGFTKKFLHAFEARAAQVEAVDAVADSIGGNIIMCGDINDTPNSYAYHTLKTGREDAFLQLGTGPGFTYRADGMWVRIDHIFYEGDFTARALKKGNKRYSDHYPIWVEFEWDE